MTKTMAVIGLAALLAPAPADACSNVPQLDSDDAVKRIAQIEFHLRYEQYYLADQAIPADLMTLGPALAERARSAEHLLDVRWRKQDLAESLHWFEDRVTAYPSSPTFQAWLAEAEAATGEVVKARERLRRLERRDLMPDAFAYRVLASITTGTERATALAKCLTRAPVKAMCGAVTEVARR